MNDKTENKALTTKDVIYKERTSYRALMDHLRNMPDGILYEKYKAYKVGGQWRFEELRKTVA